MIVVYAGVGKVSYLGEGIVSFSSPSAQYRGKARRILTVGYAQSFGNKWTFHFHSVRSTIPILGIPLFLQNLFQPLSHALRHIPAMIDRYSSTTTLTHEAERRRKDALSSLPSLHCPCDEAVPFSHSFHVV